MNLSLFGQRNNKEEEHLHQYPFLKFVSELAKVLNLAMIGIPAYFFHWPLYPGPIAMIEKGVYAWHYMLRPAVHNPESL